MAQLTRKKHKEKKDEYIRLLRSTGREHIDDLIGYLETTDFFTAPARAEHGCAYPGGLLEHSLDVYQALKDIAVPGLSAIGNALTEDMNITDDTLIIVALLHDLCKVGTFYVTRVNRKNYDQDVVAQAPEYAVKSDKDGKFIWESVPGYRIEESVPLGQGEKSVIMAMRYIKLTDEEIYAIRWHRGYADAEKNTTVSNVFAQCPLALALYEADLTATFITEKTKLR